MWGSGWKVFSSSWMQYLCLCCLELRQVLLMSFCCLLRSVAQFLRDCRIRRCRWTFQSIVRMGYSMDSHKWRKGCGLVDDVIALWGELIKRLIQAVSPKSLFVLRTLRIQMVSASSSIAFWYLLCRARECLRLNSWFARVAIFWFLVYVVSRPVSFWIRKCNTILYLYTLNETAVKSASIGVGRYS